MLKNKLLYECRTASTVFARPAQADPTAAIQTLVPFLVTLPEQVFAYSFPFIRGQWRRLIRLQPFPYIHPICFLLGCIVEFHRWARSGLDSDDRMRSVKKCYIIKSE